MSGSLYVQYGSGWCAPEGWHNFDASPTLRFERIPVLGRLYAKNAARFPKNVLYGDIVKGLPVSDSSCRAVYCSHVLEHLSLNDFRTALRNTHRLLHQGGVFRLVMPDLEAHVKRYLETEAPTASITLLSESGLGLESRPKGPLSILASVLGNSRHLWLWDYKAARVELESAAFRNIRRAQFGDSPDLRFREVEEEVRWTDCLGIECHK